MDRLFRFFFAAILMIFLSGCSGLSWTSAGSITPPVNTPCPLEGKWTVVQNLFAEGHSETENPKWAEDVAQFTGAVVKLGGSTWNNPGYKIKKVNSTDYVMTKYLSLSDNLIPVNEVVDVITVSTADKFLGEFMKIDDHRVVAFVQNNVLLLQKVSEHVDSFLTKTARETMVSNRESEAGAAGVLLVLKIPEKNDVVYRTLWLAADNKDLRQPLQADSIFFPRTSGFWELEVRSTVEAGSTVDALSARDVSTKASEIQSEAADDKLPVPKVTQKRIINYIGNDYVAITNELNGISQYQVLPVDKISSPAGISVSDIIGFSESTAFVTARNRARELLYARGIDRFDEDSGEQNFGLFRKNGHWYLTGRINFEEKGQQQYMDYNINVIPPASLISYDTLCLSWQNIKERVPDAEDAFTSPNQKIAVVKTATSLYVFGISDEQLDSQPLARIEIKKGVAVVMAEWATGFYVDNWEKAFLANGAGNVPGQNQKYDLK